MNYLFVDGNSLGYYHQQSDKLHNGEMEVQAAFGFGNGFSQRIISIMHDFFMERSQPVLGIGHERTHLSGL